MSTKPGSPGTKPLKEPKAPKEDGGEEAPKDSDINVLVLPYPVAPGTLAMPEETLAEVEHKLGHLRTDLKTGYPHDIKVAMQASFAALKAKLPALIKEAALPEKDNRKWVKKLKALEA